MTTLGKREFQKLGNCFIERAPMRKLIWFTSGINIVWVCSNCAWEFTPQSPAKGKTMEETQKDFEMQRDKEFAAHVCAEHPMAEGEGKW